MSVSVEKINYKSELYRLATYNNWPAERLYNICCLLLARLGFYYSGVKDSVTVICFKCNAVIDNWQSYDDLIRRHKNVNPNCTSFTDVTNIALKLLNDGIAKNSIGNCVTESDSCDASHATEKESSILALTYEKSFLRAQRRGLFVISGDSVSIYDIDFNNPNYENLKSEVVRLQTFRDSWPVSSPVKPEDLAWAGFFYTGNKDRVQCAFCRNYLHNWADGDVPLKEHQTHFSNCSFIRGLEVGNVPKDRANQYTPTSVRALEAPKVPELSKDAVVSIPYSQNLPTTSAREIIRKYPSEDIASPKHLQFATDEARYNSFRSARPEFLPKGQPIRVLVEAGFFYVGPYDNVKCFCCDGGLKNWQEEDYPWFEHARWFPRCKYVQLNAGEEYIRYAQSPRTLAIQQHVLPNQLVGINRSLTQTPTFSQGSFNVESREIKARMDTHMVKCILEMGYPRDLVRKTIERRLRSTGDDFPNAESLLDAVLQFQEDQSLPLTQYVTTGTSLMSNNTSVSQSNRNQLPTLFDSTAPKSNSVSAGAVVAASVTNAPPSPSASEATEKSKNKSRTKKKKQQTGSKQAANNTESNVKPAKEASAAKNSEVQIPTDLQMVEIDPEAQSLLEENKLLREARTCKVCMDKEVNVVFLPCGHLVCCSDCAPELRNCAICRALIRGTVKIFLS